MIFISDFEDFINKNEDDLLTIWDEYKYEHYCGEYFHHDDVDWFNEDLFEDMCSEVWESIKPKSA